MPQVIFRAPAELRIRCAAFHSPLAQLSSIRYPPALSFLLIHSSPVPDPVPPHVSCFRYLSCFMFPALNPDPHSILLRITSPCSIFVPMFFCPNPCPFPETLLCSFQYFYVESFLYVPQSEIDIDCSL